MLNRTLGVYQVGRSSVEALVSQNGLYSSACLPPYSSICKESLIYSVVLVSNKNRHAYCDLFGLLFYKQNQK